MADILRIKRRSGGAAGAPASLANAELAYNETDHTLYIGEGTGGAGGSATVVVPIGGTGLAPLNSPAFTGSPTVPTVARPNSSTLAASTAFVTGAISDAVQGLSTKAAVLAATTGNITLSSAQTIDGVAVAGGDRVLVKDQTLPATNGIYLVGQAGAWTRAPDMDAWGEVQDAYTFVMQGTVNADTGWVCTADPAGVLGTTPLPWVQFSSAGQIAPGNGLSKTGNTLNVVGTASRISVGAAVDIDAAYVGQASITTLGTVAAGTWNATTIAVGRGGTGATSLTGYVKGNGASAMTAAATIPNADIAGLGSMALQAASAVNITGGVIDGIVIDGGVF